VYVSWDFARFFISFISELKHLLNCLSLLQLKRVMESDSASTEDLIAYNIIPIDATTSTNAVVFFPEVIELSFFKTFFFFPFCDGILPVRTYC